MTQPIGRMRSGLQTHIATCQRFMVHADDKLSAFIELKSVNGACGELF